MSRVGRNEPCPCGSGKKFKKCCELSAGTVSGYTSSDRQVALAALEELVSGPGWERLEAEAEGEFWGELDPEQPAFDDDETLALMSEQVSIGGSSSTTSTSRGDASSMCSSR
jgi:SEC-C motif